MSINYISQIPQEKEIISETKTKTLFIFNPEHDFALAVGSDNYTPPAEVVKIRNKYSLLPATYAGDGDFIIVPDDVISKDISSLPWYKNVLQKNLTILHWKDLPNNFEKISRILPWGWDHAIHKELKINGVNPILLPSLEEIGRIRELSHRRNTITFRNTIADILNEDVINPPVELFSVREVERILERENIYFFKAPWSSSGRGIVVTDHITRKGLLEWSHGIIRRQGSVMVEKAWNRIFDFASEWWIKNGEAKFLGYAVFRSSSRGKYHGNVEVTQEEMIELIKKEVPTFHEGIIESQKKALNLHISPFYSGPLGIDMLADNDGLINPCVEINLRFTMGHLPIFHYDNKIY